MPARRRRFLILLVATLFFELALLYPGVFLRGEAITSSALGYGMQPWKAHTPAEERPLRGNPVLSDDLILFTPWDKAVRSSIESGHAPLWNRESGCGMPLLANNQSAVLAPTHVLRWLWNSPHARTIGLMAKPLIAGSGMFLLLSQWGIAFEGALVGALAWANASVMTVWMMYPLSETAAWFSWVLLGISRLLGIGTESKGRPDASSGSLILPLSLAAVLLSGHLPTAAQLLTAAAGGTAVILAVVPEARRRAGRIILPVMGGLLLSMPQVLTTGAYFLDSSARLGRGGQAAAALSSIPVRGAWSWLVVRGFGSPERYGYWGPMNINEATASVGLAPLVLAILGIAIVRDRFTKVLVLLVASSAALAYGLPPLPWLSAHIPVLAFCAGQRWIILTQWGLAALAARSVVALQTLPRRRLLFALSIAGAVLLAAITLHPSPVSEGSPAALVVPHAREVLKASFELVVACLAIALLASRWKPAGIASIATMTALAGIVFAWGFNPTIPTGAIPADTRETRALSGLLGQRRVFPAGWVLCPNTSLLASLPSVTGHDDLVPRRYSSFMSAAGVAPLGADNLDTVPLPLIRRCAAGVVVSDRPAERVGLDAVTDLQGPNLWAWNVETPHPLLGFYPKAVCASDETRALALLKSPELQDGTVVLECDRRDDVGSDEADDSSQPHEVAFQWVGNDAVALISDAARPGWLVFRETADSGWRALVDGRVASWLVADGMFIAVRLEPGDHRVEFVYRPSTWTVGLLLAAGGAALILVTPARAVARRRRQKRL